MIEYRSRPASRFRHFTNPWGDGKPNFGLRRALTRPGPFDHQPSCFSLRLSTVRASGSLFQTSVLHFPVQTHAQRGWQPHAGFGLFVRPNSLSIGAARAVQTFSSDFVATAFAVQPPYIQNPSESNQIQPNPTKSVNQSKQIQPAIQANPSKSNLIQPNPTTFFIFHAGALLIKLQSIAI